MLCLRARPGWRSLCAKQLCSHTPNNAIYLSWLSLYFRLYGHSTATYESGSLRRFLLGRTDTIRSCTSASHAYCQAMVNSDRSATEKVKLLQQAVAAHRKYTDEVGIYFCISFVISRRAIGPGTGDIPKPPVRLSVSTSRLVFALTRKFINVFSQNFAGTCTKSWGCAV